MTDYSENIVQIAKKAGVIIMKHYSEAIEVERKDDDSPVTAADKDANDYIVDELLKLTPDIPVVAEENSAETNHEAGKAANHWLVDPLDGTKSFIKKTGEFTVNIALIQEGKPVCGVVYIPVQEKCYFTGNDGKAYRQQGEAQAEVIQCRPIPDEGAVVVASHSHRTPETDAYINGLEKVQSIVSAASSMKFCLVAEGVADLYPRYGRTMEWDTAAGHAVILAAGGVVEQVDGAPMIYGKEDLANPYFIVKGCV